MKKGLRVPFVALFGAVIAFHLISTMWIENIEVVKAETKYEDLKEQVVVNEIKEDNKVTQVNVAHEIEEIPEEPKVIYSSPVDFSKLPGDTLAWIKIDGTKVDYPVMRDDGNDKYLYADINGNYSAAGSIYVDSNNEKILYGHHMKSGSMFAAIDDYRNENFFKSHQSVNLYYKDREISLKPVACVEGPSDVNVLNIDDTDAFMSDKNLVVGDLSSWNDEYVFITCNYSGNNYRTYLFCEEI